MNVTLKNGNKGILTVDTKAQKVVLETNGITYLIAYLRDNSVKIKSDLFLNEGDMAYVKTQMAQFVKKVETGKKGRK